jgi:hypothetical protein
MTKGKKKEKIDRLIAEPLKHLLGKLYINNSYDITEQFIMATGVGDQY